MKLTKFGAFYVVGPKDVAAVIFSRKVVKGEHTKTSYVVTMVGYHTIEMSGSSLLAMFRAIKDAGGHEFNYILYTPKEIYDYARENKYNVTMAHVTQLNRRMAEAEGVE